MIEAPHYSAAGEKRTQPFALPGEVFDGTVNEDVLHQAVKTFLNNQRQGTAKTKTRTIVSGGNQKPWKQKGTGRARVGSTPRAALARRRRGLRSDSAELPRRPAEEGAAARPALGAQRPGPRGHAGGDRSACHGEPEDPGAARPAGQAGAGCHQDPDPHRRRQAHGVPERSQRAAPHRAAVQRCHGL